MDGSIADTGTFISAANHSRKVGFLPGVRRVPARFSSESTRDLIDMRTSACKVLFEGRDAFIKFVGLTDTN